MYLKLYTHLNSLDASSQTSMFLSGGRFCCCKTLDFILVDSFIWQSQKVRPLLIDLHLKRMQITKMICDDVWNQFNYTMTMDHSMVLVW